jgi:putative oxidoreductase
MLRGRVVDHDILLLLARICVSIVFVYSGVDKFVCWNDALKFCHQHKMPQPKAILATTAVLHIVCGLMVLLGVLARAGAVLLLLFTIITTLWVHNPIGRPRDDFRHEMMISLEHLAIVGGLLLIAVMGPGPLALWP